MDKTTDSESIHSDDSQISTEKNKPLLQELSNLEERPCKKIRILNEPIVENQDDFNEMFDAYQGDTRGLLGIQDQVEIEIKWTVEYEDHIELQWFMHKVIKADTKEFHSFKDPEDKSTESLPVRAPIVQVIDEENETSDLVFINKHEVYSIEYDSILLWRHQGDTWDLEENENSHLEDCTIDSKKPLRPQIENIINTKFVDLVKEHKTKLEKFSFQTQIEFGKQVLLFREKLTKNVIEFFEQGNSFMQEADINVVVSRTLLEIDEEKST